MANTTPIYARIDSDLKKSAEEILATLGINPTSAIQMFYSQIVLNNGLPFSLSIPENKPLNINAMTQDQIDEELQKGIDSGEPIPMNKANQILKKELGL